MDWLTRAAANTFAEFEALLQPIKPSSRATTIQDFLHKCGPQQKDSASLTEVPPRVLLPSEDNRGFKVVPYVGATDYIAVSYTWPNESWSRLHNSNIPIRIDKKGSRHFSHHVSQFTWIVLSGPNGTWQTPIWVDHECIELSDPDEQAAQAAVENRIYSKAKLTIVLLEDVEIGVDEIQLLLRTRQKSDDEKRGIG